MDKIDRIVVIHDYSIAEGGAGILALKAVEQYRARGYPVTLLTGQATTDHLEDLGVTVSGLNSQGLLERSALQAMRDGIHNSNTVAMIGRWIAEHDTPGTVYHLNNWAQILSPTIYKALRPVADRTLVTCHDFFNVCPNGSFLHFGKSEPCDAKPMSTACFMKQCDRRNAIHKYWRFARHMHLNRIAQFDRSPSTFSFIHEEMRLKFRRAGFSAPDTVVIPNPVDAWTNARIRAEKNAGYLFVGRLGRDKGADIALKATSDAGTTITMVGSGELEREASRNFPHARLTGWLQPGEIAQYARKARALIVPSRVTEPFGLVILEAAMSGLPVIVSDSAYLSTDVEHLGFGRRFSVNDPRRLVELLEMFSHDDSLIEKMSHKAYEHAPSLCHTAASWTDAHIDVFNQKLSRASVPSSRQLEARENALRGIPSHSPFS